jgi:hypothetical protein
MNLAATIYLTSKLIAWISTFAIFSFWLEVNSAGDRAIQRVVGRAGALASQAVDYFVGLTM